MKAILENQPEYCLTHAVLEFKNNKQQKATGIRKINERFTPFSLLMIQKLTKDSFQLAT
jgi:hypothetical protein